MVNFRGSSSTLSKSPLAFLCIFALCSFSAFAQKPGTSSHSGQQGLGSTTVTLSVSVRDASGVPMDGVSIVTLVASVGSYNQTLTTRDASTAVFEGLPPGEYEAEARYPGYQSTTEHISVNAMGSTLRVFIYLVPESDNKSQGPSPAGIVMSPKLQAEMDKGLEAMRKGQFEIARAHFAKGLGMAPGNPDLSYLIGTAELGLNHSDLARQDFEHALAIDPTHERALLALGELQLRSGDYSAAISTLEKAFLKNGAGWRTQLLLASAYSKAGRLAEGETCAQHAVDLAKEKSAGARLLLGEIQRAEGKIPEAENTLKDLVAKFPGDPSAEEGRKRLATLSAPRVAAASQPAVLANLPVPSVPSAELMPAEERPWAPADIDSREFPLAQDAPCTAEEILPRAQHRLKSQLQNFEKFTATEHIDHQEIDRLGRPGPVKSRDFSYIVFVNRYAADSFFLDEDRYSPGRDSSFPTSLATQGLNNLGVSIIQPATRRDFVYTCEGLAGIRGKATWQIRFQEKNDSVHGIRDWRRNGTLYHVPLKGRIWISSASYDVLRIETDLLAPVQNLGLTRDHLLVDYGPVNFTTSPTTLWLPWSAEMHMEIRGHRYHHKHYLTNYMLFEVDTSNKIGKPPNPPPPPDSPSTQATSAGDPNSP
jgi:tetratricopeptide (TPR) repeat protein